MQMHSGWALQVVAFFLWRTASFASAFQSTPTRAPHHRARLMQSDSLSANTATAKTPGALRRRLFGEPPKLGLPLSLISAVVAALKAANAVQAASIFFQTLTSEQQRKNTALPISYKPYAELDFYKDCLTAQRQARLHPLPPFLLTLTPEACDNLSPNDRKGQRQWLQEHAALIRELKLAHGGVYFKSWALFDNAEGVSQAWQALNLTPCRDPKEIRGPTPLLPGSSTIYQTLNSPEDAATHLGLHFEGIPGIMPSSALFACFQAAESGGEFLVCDGRRIFRDLDPPTLAHLEEKKLQPTFAELPDWMASSPLSSWVPWATQLHHELLALLTDLTKPTDDFFLDLFPKRNTTNDTATLKLTTHPTVPVIHHPVTGQAVWFSGMDAGHRGNFARDNPHLTDGGGKYASEVFDVRYGDDGTEICESDLQQVRRACQQNTRTLAMKPGDAVFLDNFTTLHGRKPFMGTRRHAVVWFLD